MNAGFRLVEPKIIPPLDENFRPAILANQHFREEVAASQAGIPLLIGLERSDGYLSHFTTQVYPDGHARAEANLQYVERIVKFLLWQKGGWQIFLGGPKSIGEYIRQCYSTEGERSFEYHFMQKDVYEMPFTVISCDPADVPPEMESSQPLGRHLDGCRIGFDLGASDRKSSAVIDGETVFSEEVIWNPKVQSDPNYHYQEIMKSLNAAAEKMPRVDAIGGSAAGIYID
ncbi:MAG: ROK family protein, partial [Anaerolineales bacterium]|nr:ROK family protein [Anaerolineales bacterium]